MDKAATLTSCGLGSSPRPSRRLMLVVSAVASLLQEFFSGYGFPSRQKPAFAISKSAVKVSSSGRGS